ncbi:hypothetical protein HDU76_011110 [Blyttiomyces sp. JEL0837]|nr:hypothetical protein HDU76_011110 [Blyttiomyces sp. JEL0837]
MSKVGYKTLFVGYFPDYILKTDIETLCKPHGTVLNITMMRGLNPETKGTSVADYALIEFKNWRQAKSAIKALDGCVFPFGHSDQRPLQAKFSHKPLPEPRSLTAKVMSGAAKKENVFVKFGKRFAGIIGRHNVKVGRELGQLPSDAQLFKLEDFDTESIAAVATTPTKPEPAAAGATFKKMAFPSEYIHEDTQKTIEYQEQTPDPFSPATETLPEGHTYNQYFVEESIPQVPRVQQDVTTDSQPETEDFEGVEETVEETAEDVAIVRASIGNLEAVVDLEKVELKLASVTTEIDNVNLVVGGIKASSVNQVDIMIDITTRVDKLKTTLFGLMEDVEKIKGDLDVAGNLQNLCSCGNEKSMGHVNSGKTGFGKLVDKVKAWIKKSMAWVRGFGICGDREDRYVVLVEA